MSKLEHRITGWKSIIAAVALLTIPQFIQAAESLPDADFFRSTGKINVVFAVIAIIFAGLVFYLIRLDRKITRLEKQFKDE